MATDVNLRCSCGKLTGIIHDASESGTKCDFPRMEKGGLDAMFFAVFV